MRWVCNICHEQVWQQLGQWFHVVATGCRGPDKVEEK